MKLRSTAPRPSSRRARAALKLTALASALALALAACGGGGSSGGGGAAGPTQGGGGEPQSGGELVIGADADPIGLDPVLTTAFSSWDFIDLIYNGLLAWDSDMQIVEDLAESYENPEPTVYEFTLRQGVTFHNGQEFTAEDVKHTFDRILDPDEASPRFSQFQNIESIEVLDDYTIRFTLTEPDAAFLSYMATKAHTGIVPRGVDGLVDNPIGTGPFKFESYEPNQQLRLVANEDYYEEGLPYLDAVTFRFFGDQASLISALRSGAIDMTWLKDPKVAATIDQPGIISAPGVTSRTFPVWFNQDEKPFDDVRVRQALSLAIDRQSMIDTVLAGSGSIAGRIPSNHVGGWVEGDPELPHYQRDVERAKALLAEAGYPNGVDLGVYKVVAANDLDVQAAQLLQEQWAEAGITVEINPMETAPLLEDWNSGNFGMLSVAQSWSPNPDAILGRFVSTSAYGQAMGFSDAELDSMIIEARTLLDEAARAELHQRIQQHVAENAYALDIYGYPLRWELWHDHVQGYEVMASNSRQYVKTTWLED